MTTVKLNCYLFLVQRPKIFFSLRDQYFYEINNLNNLFKSLTGGGPHTAVYWRLHFLCTITLQSTHLYPWRPSPQMRSSQYAHKALCGYKVQGKNSGHYLLPFLKDEKRIFQVIMNLKLYEASSEYHLRLMKVDKGALL